MLLAMHSEIYSPTSKRVCNINHLSSLHDTRASASSKLIINGIKCTSDKLCFAVAAQRQWNFLPNPITVISTRPFFQKQLFKFVINQLPAYLLLLSF